MVKTWGDETNPKWSTVKAKEVREREECEKEKEGILRGGIYGVEEPIRWYQKVKSQVTLLWKVETIQRSFK